LDYLTHYTYAGFRSEGALLTVLKIQNVPVVFDRFLHAFVRGNLSERNMIWKHDSFFQSHTVCRTTGVYILTIQYSTYIYLKWAYIDEVQTYHVVHYRPFGTFSSARYLVNGY
jgi:hypothetical protein